MKHFYHNEYYVGKSKQIVIIPENALVITIKLWSRQVNWFDTQQIQTICITFVHIVHIVTFVHMPVKYTIQFIIRSGSSIFWTETFSMIWEKALVTL